MTQPKPRFTPFVLFVIVFIVSAAPSFAQSTDQDTGQQETGQEANQPSQEAPAVQSPALEELRTRLSAQENVLAELREAFEPQQAEALRRREQLDPQLMALNTQVEALRAQEAVLNAQESVTSEQQSALELQRQALNSQYRALRPQIEEVRALETEVETQAERVRAQEAKVQAVRDEVAQAEGQAERQRAVAQAAGQGLLETLLVTLEQNPRYRAAQAAVDAAEAQLSAAYNPASLQVQGAYNTTDTDPNAAPQPEPQQQQPEEGDEGQLQGAPNVTQFSADATFRPFPYGDTRDAVEQQELALENAVLDFREAVAGLERQALEAALQFQLAQQSVGLVQNALEVARTALGATQTRFERGAANERELRDAQANFQQAQTSLQSAQGDLELARFSLRNLNLEEFIRILESRGDEDISSLISLPRVNEGLPLAVQRSQISLSQASIGVGTAQRDLIPTAQASYNYNLDDNSSISASIESRTLQPSLGYSYQDPARSLPESAVNSSFQIGVSASISFGVFDQIDAAKSQRLAAQAGIEAAQEGASIQSASLETALNQAERAVELEQIQFRNAQRNVEEDQQRQELGLITPLEAQQSLVDLLEADLELRQARFSALQTLLDTYEFYALPPSEALQ